uniref:BspA family leucine-rich repeat surface protein n=1 Tax=Lactococcus garvieae TaxID=1363 RepID=UPI00254E740A
MKKIFYKYIVLFLIITFTGNLFHHIFTVVYAEHINISNDEGKTTKNDINVQDNNYTWSGLSIFLDNNGVLHIPAGSVNNPDKLCAIVPPDSVKKIAIDGPLVISGSAKELFSNLNNLTEMIGTNNINTSSTIDMQYMFYHDASLKSLDLQSLDTSNVSNMSSMFDGMKSLANLNIQNFNTSKVIDMSHMFYGASSLISLNLTTFDTSSVIDMSQMFRGASSLVSLDLTNFNTSQVTNMSEMFYEASSLISLNLTNFNTSQVTNMSHMFAQLISLISLDLGNFQTSKVSTMFGMFWQDYSLINLNIENFDMRQIPEDEKKDMFYQASIQVLKIGSYFVGSQKMSLDNPKYTGKWQNIGSGTISQPMGRNIWTTTEFMDNYNGLKDADTYVWQPIPVIGGNVTVKYVNEKNNPITKDIVLSGNVGEHYDTEQKNIPGYTFKEVQGKPSGAFVAQEQTVTYKYTKNPVIGGDVTVKYVDEKNNLIIKDIVLSGNVGEHYDTEQKNIPGYTFKEVQGKPSGAFVAQEQT